jgi:DNA-binding beta-propeller fold protein YncE
MVQTDLLSYEVVQNWEQIPDGMTHPDVAGVAVDSQDQVYLICRGEHPIMVYERDGTFVKSWGQGLFTLRTHGITVGPDDMLYCTDDGNHTVRKFTPDGQLLLTLGTSGVASDTGYVHGDLNSIAHGGPPFNRPTNLAVAPNGELYVSDGYGNARVHRFSASGELVQSWGQPGIEPGQFHLPHGIAVDRNGRVLVADRENDRVQVFSPEGEFLTIWTDVQRPTQIFIDREDRLYVSELWWHVGQFSYAHGEIEQARPGRVSVLDLDGNVLARWGNADACAPGSFVAPHGLCVDSHGDVYVAEVTWTFAVSRGLAPPDCHTLQKFASVPRP